jgi:hypothetical protein
MEVSSSSASSPSMHHQQLQAQQQNGSHERIRLEDLDKNKYYFSGFVLYTISSLLANPYLLVKRRQQLGMNGGVMKTFATEGLGALFRGGSLCWVSGCNRMIYFTIYEHVTNAMEQAHITEHKRVNDHVSNIKQSLTRGTAGLSGLLLLLAIITIFIHVF